MDAPKLTPKQYLKLHPDRYVMVTYEFGNPVFIAPLKNLQIQVTPNRNEAEIWSELDTSPTKLQYHIASTGYKGLEFEKIKSALNTYNLRNVNDIKQFFSDIHEFYPLEWHPDDDFYLFMKDDEKTRAFTDDEAENLNKIMTECFQYCEVHDLDIYELAAEVQTDLWMKQGKWPENE